ncbi:T9SS type A sorting domain-containing protein [Portibacter marinus]|uniref:T9SS type A sorting domain-containing protein n=1 Tax=Portibacter marinus TaxID=2898660 RepID=UPI001F3918FE|nr:T9SS type A sorting domain-containing protein [Portibacter marinus]
MRFIALFIILHSFLNSSIHAQEVFANALESINTKDFHQSAASINDVIILNKYRKGSSFRLSTQIEYRKVKQPLCNLLASKDSPKSYIAPPSNFDWSNQHSRGASDCSKVKINYNFPSDINKERRAAFVNAFEYAVAIWESQLSGQIETEIDADFRNLGSSILGQARSNYVFRLDSNSPWYPEALLNQLVGANLSELRGLSLPEITTIFNTGFGWYLGTDGNPPPGTYDFVTVVLHELGHGMGFFGSAVSNSRWATYGLGGTPFIYDQFVQNKSGQSIFELAPISQYSSSTLNLFQSDNLYIKSPSMSSQQKIYAPRRFRSGSSYSHWDEDAFPPGSKNSLMTPFLGFQEANHNPGSNTRHMFEDHGWILAEDCDGPKSQDLSERCQITGIRPDPNFFPFVCDNPGLFSPEGGFYGPVGSHVMCFRVDGIDPFNQPLDLDDYEVKIGGKNVNVLFVGYDLDDDGEQYFSVCVGGVPSTGRENIPVKIKLASGCTFTQGKYYDAPDCGFRSIASPRTTTMTDELDLSFSPNPVRGTLYLEVRGNDQGSLVIRDYSGRMLQNFKVDGQRSIELDVASMTSGLYFATFVSESQTITKRFVKQ